MGDGHGLAGKVSTVRSARLTDRTPAQATVLHIPCRCYLPKQGRMSKRVLAIQSHVVSGYVGNKCATFPLQLLGYDVDPVMSVHFSNHTGFPSFKGTVMQGPQLKEIADGMEANGLIQHSHMITGYIGSDTFLEEVLDVLRRVRAARPEAMYVCDPVLGDDGRLYVPEELVQVYRDKVVPQADLLTPNQFELEQLTGCQVTNVHEAQAACLKLHKAGVPAVVVTSLRQDADDTITVLGSTTQPQQTGPQCFSLQLPRIDAAFTGTGDLLTALLLAHVSDSPDRLAHAVEQAVAGVQGVLRTTLQIVGQAAPASDKSAAAAQSRELRLIQAHQAILHPDVKYHAEAVT